MSVSMSRQILFARRMMRNSPWDRWMNPEVVRMGLTVDEGFVGSVRPQRNQSARNEGIGAHARALRRVTRVHRGATTFAARTVRAMPAVARRHLQRAARLDSRRRRRTAATCRVAPWKENGRRPHRCLRIKTRRPSNLSQEGQAASWRSICCSATGASWNRCETPPEGRSSTDFSSASASAASRASSSS